MAHFFNRSVWSLFAIILLWQPLRVYGVGAMHPPSDHAGQDLFLKDGAKIWGSHTGVGILLIPATATVSILPYDPAIAGSGTLDVEAETIIIEGSLDANGAGFTGGGGGQGGPGQVPAGPYVLAGVEGISGKGRYAGFSSFGRYGMVGDGPFGGLVLDVSGHRDGGYLAYESNGDETTDTLVVMGSGGSGGTGSDGYGGSYGFQCGAGAGGRGGDGGGPGGGAISLFATKSLKVMGSISTKGRKGEIGQDGEPSYCSSYRPPCPCINGDGGNGGNGFGEETASDPTT